jgi:hypothetical protein
MPRVIPTDLLTALSKKEIQPYYAVEIKLDSGDVRLWTGLGEKTIEGETYFGAGNLLNIDGLEEASDLGAKNAELTLSGIPPELISLALQEPYQRRRVKIMFGEQSVPDVVTVFSGFANTLDIIDEADSSAIKMTVESRLVELERPRIRRYTQSDHTSRHPTDTFFSFVADLQDREIVWGREVKK